jgi:hypothetical protein
MIESLGKLLSYGAIGLGLALAVLAFMLLAAEQKIAKPRQKIMTAIYVYMSFSLLLAGGGFAIEVYKLFKQQANSLLLAGATSDEVWTDIVNATRLKLFGSSPQRREYSAGYLRTGEITAFSARTETGRCFQYFAMTKPPAEIKVEVRDQNRQHSILGAEPHMSFGRIYEGKGIPYGPVIIQATMTKGEGPIIIETYP